MTGVKLKNKYRGSQMRTSDETIWYWYQKIQECMSSNFNTSVYCRNNNLDYSMFCRFKFRIVYISNTEPETYKKWVDYAKAYKKSTESIIDFCKIHNIPSKKLSFVGTHLTYLDIIEKMKKKMLPKESVSSEMSFVEIPSGVIQQPLIQPLSLTAEVQGYKVVSEIPEVIESKNDIEITINKGVKVIIAPNIDPLKIIKIIELLKDL